MSMMKMAGKTSDNKAVAISCNNDGNVNVSKVWEQGFFTIMENVEVRDTNAIATNNENQAVDCQDYAFISLRVSNGLDADIKINVYDDEWVSTTSWLKDAYGDYIAFTIPKNSTCAVTPDDLPFLKYCKYFKMRIEPLTAPTAGSLTIKAFGKR